MYKLTISSDKYDEENIDGEVLYALIQRFESKRSLQKKMMQNKDVYDGKHAILQKTREEGAPNVKVVCNHAKDISDTASSYFAGNPITFKVEKGTEEKSKTLLDAFTQAEADEADNDNALNMSIYGVSYDYVYAKEGKTELSVKTLSPKNTFIVYDDTIEQNPLFAVYYYVRKDDSEANKFHYVATVLTKTHKHTINLRLKEGSTPIDTEEISKELHNMGDIPVVEWQNNKDCYGDFEQQIGLIEAYNTVMSDRVNDKEQIIDALLVIYGAQLADEEEGTKKAKKSLKKDGLLELPDDAKAEYLIRSFDEGGVETLRKAIKEDIYSFSHVPNLSDEHFVGNSSGVAMEYKLLGLEMITRTKERYYRKGLRQRITLFCNYLKLKAIAIDPNLITPVFSRALPKNVVELSQVVSNLWNKVGKETLLGILPFVEDAENELEVVERENKEAIEQQQKMFGGNENTPPEGVDGDPEEDA